MISFNDFVILNNKLWKSISDIYVSGNSNGLLVSDSIVSRKMN